MAPTPKSTPKSTDTVERPPGDLGVPMLPGSDTEPTGPEDALGEGPKRGDYTDRIGDPKRYHPHSGTTPQRPNADDIGDAPGEKGGVTTDAG
jgi:hypothetical protein